MLLLSPHLWNENWDQRVWHWANMARNWHLNLELKVLTISLYNHPTFHSVSELVKETTTKGGFTLELKTVDEFSAGSWGNPALGTSPTWVYYIIREVSHQFHSSAPQQVLRIWSQLTRPFSPPTALCLPHISEWTLPLVSGAHITPCALMPLF